jgi:hypothetical protein
MGTNSRHPAVLSQLDIDFKTVLLTYKRIQASKPDTDMFTQEAGKWADEMRQALVCVLLPIIC